MHSLTRVACVLAVAAALGNTARPAGAQQLPVGTAEVFRRHADRVVRIQVVESGSAAKSTLGSGFFVGDGLVVTNYHVISRLVTDSARHRAELTDTRGETHPVRVLAIDVVHDLAVVHSDASPRSTFDIKPVELDQGERLYALGHPHDLGLTITEGTYNGPLKYVLYPKILFSGSLNPGMSGGPAIDTGGRVVGVNVSTAGNEISFLVPVDRVIALLERVRRPETSARSSLLAEAALQLRAYQDGYIARIFSDSIKRVTLGRFSLPTEPAPFFKCWADADRDEEDPYESVQHFCSTDDHVFISGEQSTGLLSLTHELLINKTLNPFRFHALYSGAFQNVLGSDVPFADAHAVTPYKCETRNVRRAEISLRAVFCLRKYRKLEGLYDALIKAAVIGSSETGLVTTLSLSGVTFENAHVLARRYLEQIAWNDQ
ncbi:MAG TPA: serine protease [Gemmatimonadaceae bacterium]|nr:serine protease [Gemmatimonadaceae bacterium]